MKTETTVTWNEGLQMWGLTYTTLVADFVTVRTCEVYSTKDELEAALEILEDEHHA